MVDPIPEAFARTIREVHGAAGEAWLRGLPDLIAASERRWSLHVLPPFTLTYNYVAPAVRADGTPVVLKVGVPNPELASEIAALRHYDGHGMVRLLEGDPEQGIALLERLEPGTPLVRLGAERDDEMTRIAAGVMRALWRPLPAEHGFPTVARWAAGLGRLRARYNGGTGPLPAALVARAEALFAELLAAAGASLLLHGDLHHENILAAERAPWLAIDPKGVAGDPGFEVGALLSNPRPDLLGVADLPRLQARRVDILAEALGMERERLVGWGVAQAVLSAWWSVEDHGYGWELAIACAEALAGLMR